MIKNLYDEFGDDIEYPDNDSILSGPDIGVNFTYVSNTYLNGLINYMDTMCAVMINRYKRYDETVGSDLSFVESCKLIDKMIENNFHTNLSNCDKFDDILILAKGNDSYYLLWRDCDCSDCCIGRLPLDTFDEKDADSILISTGISVLQYDTPHKSECALRSKIKYIPKEMFRGWITL